MGYREDLPTYAPPWMTGPYGRTLLESVGAELDNRAEQVMWARLQSNPFAGDAVTPTRSNAARLADGRLIECEEFVLPIHARQRGLPVYPTMPTLGTRVQLSQWWQRHARRGVHLGEMQYAQTYFIGLSPALPQITIVHQDGAGASATWHRLSPAGAYSIHRQTPSNFDYDGQTSKWARWWAFIEMAGTGFTGPNKYDDGHTYDDGAVYDAGDFAYARQVDLAQMFQDWHSAGSYLAGVILVWSGTLDPTATPTQDPTGWWNLPNGANTWAALVDPTTGLGTRPPNMQWIFDPGPG